jgi:hypothetical protein
VNVIYLLELLQPCLNRAVLYLMSKGLKHLFLDISVYPMSARPKADFAVPKSQRWYNKDSFHYFHKVARRTEKVPTFTFLFVRALNSV